MSKPYLVVDAHSGYYDDFETKEDAVSFSKRWAKREQINYYVYKLIADVVVETRTVVEVIEHEHH